MNDTAANRPPVAILYGRKQGKKLRQGQLRLMRELLPRLRVAVPKPAPGEDAVGLDPRTLFTPAAGRRIWLEIGFGAGEHLIWQAEQHPEVGLIGCEAFINGVAACLAGIEKSGSGNIRLFDDDARLLLAALAPASLERVFILFPDPWPKRRHHRRRIVSRQTLDRLAELMPSGGELRLATDDPDYLRWMVEHACFHPSFQWLAEGPQDWRQRPPDWPPTRYEVKMLAGRRPAFLALRRR